MNDTLDGKIIAILAMDGFDASELTPPQAALEYAGALTQVVSPNPHSIKSWQKDRLAGLIAVDVRLRDAGADEFDALLIPGGVMNIEQLRARPEAVKFVRGFFEAGKPVAAICEGVQMLIDAGVVRGRKVTSDPAMKDELIGAGAEWSDGPVAVDEGLVTAGILEDLVEFNENMIEQFADGVYPIHIV